MNFDFHILVDADPEAAFSYVVNFDNLMEWDSSVLSVRRGAVQGVTAGATWHLVIRSFGQRQRFLYSLDELEPGRRAVLRGMGESATVTDEIVVTPTRSGAIIHWRIGLQLTGVGASLSWLLKPLLRRAFGRAVRQLQQQLQVNDGAAAPIRETAQGG